MSSNRLVGDQAAKFRSQTFDLGELLPDAFKERRLNMDAFFDQETGCFSTAAKDTGLDQLLQLLLRLRRNFHRDHVIVLRRDRFLDGPTDVAADGAERFRNARRDVAN